MHTNDFFRKLYDTISSYTQKLLVSINDKTIPNFSIFRFESVEIRIKSSIIWIIISKSDIGISIFDKIIQKISMMNDQYNDSFLIRFTVGKNNILLIEL